MLPVKVAANNKKKKKALKAMLGPVGAVGKAAAAADMAALKNGTDADKLRALDRMMNGGRRRGKGAAMTAASTRVLRTLADISYAGAQKSSGGGVRESADHDYPTRVRYVIAGGPFKMQPSRLPFDPNTTVALIADIKKRTPKVRTTQDKTMLANPNASLKAKGIDRAHRLANSSVLAISHNIFNRLYASHRTAAAPSTAALKPVAIAFFAAVCGDKKMAEAAYQKLEDVAKTATQARQAKQAVEAVGNAVADAPHNLRFGDAKTNRIILHGFDPNTYADGSMTPRSKGMADAGQDLVPHLDLGAVDAAFTQTTEKATGDKLSSSGH